MAVRTPAPVAGGGNPATHQDQANNYDAFNRLTECGLTNYSSSGAASPLAVTCPHPSVHPL